MLFAKFTQSHNNWRWSKFCSNRINLIRLLTKILPVTPHNFVIHQHKPTLNRSLSSHSQYLNKTSFANAFKDQDCWHMSSIKNFESKTTSRTLIDQPLTIFTNRKLFFCFSIFFLSFVHQIKNKKTFCSSLLTVERRKIERHRNNVQPHIKCHSDHLLLWLMCVAAACVLTRTCACSFCVDDFWLSLLTVFLVSTKNKQKKL